MKDRIASTFRSSLTGFLSDGRWTRCANALLGVWLFASAYAWSHTRLTQAGAWIVGSGLFISSLAALRWPSLRWIGLVLSIVLLIASYAVGGRPATIGNNAVLLLLVCLLSLEGNAPVGQRTRHGRTALRVRRLAAERVREAEAPEAPHQMPEPAPHDPVLDEPLRPEEAPTKSELVWKFNLLSRIGGALLIALGVIVLFGWLAELSTLTRLHPSITSMKPNTALSFALAGWAIWLLGKAGPARRIAANVLAGIVLAISVTTLAEYAWHWDAHIDELLFTDPEPKSEAERIPGRMSLVTAVLFFVMALALLTEALRWRGGRPAHWLALGIAAASMVTLIAFAYGVRGLHDLPPFSSIALHTGAAFGVGSLSILGLRPEEGWTRVLVSSGPHGLLARSVLPGVVLFPILLGWLQLRGQDKGWYQAPFGAAMFATSTIVCFCALVWSTARAIDNADRVRRATEKRLRESEEDLSSTVNSIGEGVIATDIDSRIRRLNPVAEQLTGFSLAEVRGHRLDTAFRIVNEETGEPVENPVKRVIRQGGTIVGLANQSVLTARDGTRRSIADNGSPIRDAAGALRGVVLVFKDQTREHEIQRGHEQNEARKSIVFEAALDPIACIDPNGEIVEFNPAARRAFGYGEGEELGKPLWQLFTPPSLATKELQALKQCFATGQRDGLGMRIEAEGRRSDGTSFPVELTVVRGGPDEKSTFIAYIRQLGEHELGQRQPNERQRALRQNDQPAPPR